MRYLSVGENGQAIQRQWFFNSVTCQFYPGEELPRKVITNAESLHSEDTEKYPF